jgi:DUF1680 family protein
MKAHIDRRDFLKVTSAAAGALAHSAAVFGHAEEAVQAPKAKTVAISSVSYTPGPGYPIQAKRHAEVTLRDSYWKPRVTTNASVTIPLLVQRQIESGSGRGFNGNVLEAAILSLETHPDAKLQAVVAARIEQLRTQPRTGNGGFEVAAAYFHATGRRDLIDGAVKAADALYADFKTNNPPFSGGERDAVNCLQLYSVTRDKKHLDLAKHYLDIRGLENSVNRSRHNQSYRPVLEQREAVGHAVNCVTLLVSLLDVGILTGLTEYAEAARRMWLDIVTRKMYVTGGVGSTGNEGFGEAYSLPTISAYAETCAVLMFATLNHRLFLASGDSKYIDVLERGIYNNALSGVSLSGNRFFYVNRLASAGDGRDTRWERASLECCPPNLVRFLASMPGYIYAQDAKGSVYVNLYLSSDARFKVRDKEIALSVDSEMPWGGKSTMTIATKEAVRAALKLRIPGWTRNIPAPGGLYSYAGGGGESATVSVNGKPVNASPDQFGYVTVDRDWQQGDRLEIQFPFAVRKVVADAKVKEARGRVAIERGPIVYCAEWPEAADRQALSVLVDASAPFDAESDATLLGGVTAISTTARRITNPSVAARPLKLTPYPLWANRGAGEMTVWLPTREYVPGDVGPAGGLIFYVNPNYATDGWRYLEAAPVDQSLGAKWGCFRTALPGARGKAIGTGRQNTADMLAACAERGTAADLCANYVLNGIKGWFLPSTDELTQMYRNLRATGAGDFRDQQMVDNCQYWTSTQQTTDMADHIDFSDNGRLHYDDKDYPRRVRAIRAF